MEFTSEPPEAIVSIDNKIIKQTPFSYPLTRKDFHSIRFHKDGYEDRIIILGGEFESGWLALDLFCYGWIVDAITGAWYEWDYDFVHGVLDKLKF